VSYCKTTAMHGTRRNFKTYLKYHATSKEIALERFTQKPEGVFAIVKLALQGPTFGLVE
jgi:hypothetical protein